MTATTPSSFFSTAFDTLARQVRTARARRAQHLALATLMDMDVHQLDDLGLNLGDIVEAINSPPPATPALVARRAHRAAHWTPDAAATAR